MRVLHKIFRYTLFLSFLTFSSSLYAQANSSIVSGIVIDNTGAPVENINVFILGETYGAATDEQGKYTFHVPSGNFTLSVSGLGYTGINKEIIVSEGSNLNLNFTLIPSSLSLDEIFVLADEPSQYVEATSYTASKIPIAVDKVPQGIHILPQKIMEQIQTVRLEDGLRYVSGITMETGFGGRTDVYQIRGFRTGWESIFKNGFRNSMRTYRETGNIKQIEALKGPSSVLYGVGDPGGLINIVTKKPLARPSYNVQFSSNSFGLIRPAVDIGGPLDKERNLRYRVNAVIEDGETYRDFVKTERYFIAPVLSYDFSDNTSLTLEGEFLKHNQPSDRGIFYDGERIADVPVSRSLGEPDNTGKVTNGLFQYDLTHKFSEGFAFKHRLNYSYSKEERSVVEQNALVKNSKELITRRYQNQNNKENYIAVQNEAYASFSTGKDFNHRLLGGIEISKYVFDIFLTRSNYDTLNIYNPVYNKYPKVAGTAPFNDYETTDYAAGFYVQEFLEVGRRLTLLAGLRYDIFEEDNDDKKTNIVTKGKNTSLNPRLGISYKLMNALTIYGNYSKGFYPQFGEDINGNKFDPLTSYQFEGGLKIFVFNDLLSFTLSYFDITQSNILTSDPADPNFSVQVGEVKSRGIEFDFAGEVLPGLNIFGSYNYIDAEVTEDNVIETGTPLRNVSPNTASFWGTYQFRTGLLSGFGFGGGINHLSERAGDAQDSFKLPEYTRVDATTFYEYGRARLALTFRNLFDVKYYEGAQSQTSIMPGVPLTVIGTVSYSL